jgi:hypothetical protein
VSLRKYKAELKNAVSTLECIDAKSYLEAPTIVDNIIGNFNQIWQRIWGQLAAHRRLRPGEAKLEHLVEWFETLLI